MKFNLKKFLELDSTSLKAINGGSNCCGNDGGYSGGYTYGSVQTYSDPTFCTSTSGAYPYYNKRNFGFSSSYGYGSCSSSFSINKKEAFNLFTTN